VTYQQSLAVVVLGAQVLEHVVHGAAVVELLLEFHALARHLDAHKHLEERACQLGDVRVLLEQLLAHKAAHGKGKGQGQRSRVKVRSKLL
jgi:hypothetical protein